MKRYWDNDSILLGFLTLANLALAWPVLGAGVVADNDFVGHYSYVLYLTQHLLPEAGTHLGWCPLYSTGLPFLLFNPPPLLYVTAAWTALVTGLPELLALKLIVLAAYLAFPLAVYGLARSLNTESRNFPRFCALLSSLFSSELFGLEFFFQNGMVNGAVALPLLVVALTAFSAALQSPWPRAWKWIALTGVAFAATLLTHVLSAYMICVGLPVMALFMGAKNRWGEGLLKLALALVAGIFLSGYWLYPSLSFTGSESANFTWIRPPWMTLKNFFLGSVFSSYPVSGGFYFRFFSTSYAGILASVLGWFGLYRAVKAKRRGVLAFGAIAGVALWISLGPHFHQVISWLPVYEKLLWYRLTTLLILAWLIVAGYGLASYFELPAGVRRYGNWVLAGLLLWSGAVLLSRSRNILTAEDFPREIADIHQVENWLSSHADGGRVFGEFLRNEVDSAISVNYLRHMIPARTGVEELAGWIYENNPASRTLQATGLLWYNALPILELAQRYNVTQVIARSPHLREALEVDPRWEARLRTPHYWLFQAVHFEPAWVEVLEGEAEIGRVERGLIQGGGYRIEFPLALAPQSARDGARLLIKTNYDRHWRASVGDLELTPQASEDGLLSLRLPPSANPGGSVSLEWRIDEPKRVGVLFSLAGMLLLAVYLGLARGWPPVAWMPSPRLVQAAGLGLALVVLIAGAIRSAGVAWERIHYDLEDGMTPVYRPETLEVGCFDDTWGAGLNYLRAERWGEPHLWEGRCGRELEPGSEPPIILTVAPGFAASLLLEGALSLLEQSFPIEIRELAGSEVLMRREARFGETIEIPAEVTARLRDLSPPLPGAALGLELELPLGARLQLVQVRSPIVYLEGESFINVLDDSGYDINLAGGSGRFNIHNGSSIQAVLMPGNDPVTVHRPLSLESGRYEVWALVDVTPRGATVPRAEARFSYNQLLIGATSGVQADLPATQRPLAWTPIGSFRAEASGSLEISFYCPPVDEDPATLQIDLIALVPVM